MSPISTDADAGKAGFESIGSTGKPMGPEAVVRNDYVEQSNAADWQTEDQPEGCIPREVKCPKAATAPEFANRRRRARLRSTPC